MAWIDEFKKLFTRNSIDQLPTISGQIKNLGTWQTLLDFLKNEEYISPTIGEIEYHRIILGHEIGNNSVIDQFDNTIDLDSDDYDPEWSFDDVIANSNKIWNKSLGNTIDYWKNNFKDNENTTSFGPITIPEIKRTDAGNEFVKDGTYVVPFSNIDSQTYTEVRGNDGVESVLNSERNLQFTRTQSDEARFLRLIMPKYTRRVEIEDLNRNFWVIGQTITGISSYLFGANSPLGNLLNSILNEVVQLWENVMYLWAQIAILTGEAPIKVIYLPLPNNSLQPYRKYDNFDGGDSSTALERVKFLADKYPKNSLVIVPYSRTHNYEHNYYSHYYIRRIIFYNRIKNKWTSRYICETGMTPYDDNGNLNNFEVVFDAADRSVTKLSDGIHGAARPVPHIEAQWKDDNIQITEFTIDFIDIGSKKLKWQLIKNADTYKNWTDADTGEGRQEHGGTYYYYVNAHIEFLEDAETVTTNSAYYLGDCVSCKL